MAGFPGEPIPLRPHHLLCLHFFAGKGYSEEFTVLMEKVKKQTESKPQTLIRLAAEDDAFCSACPHHRDGVCDTAEKVKAYDAEVLRLTGLAPGERLPWERASALVREKILTAGKRTSVCGDCSWNDICRL